MEAYNSEQHIPKRKILKFHPLGRPCGSAGKESACNARDLGLIPGLGRPPGEGKGYPLQYSGLENSMDYTVHGGLKESDTTDQLSLHLGLKGPERKINRKSKSNVVFCPHQKFHCPRSSRCLSQSISMVRKTKWIAIKSFMFIYSSSRKGEKTYKALINFTI